MASGSDGWLDGNPDHGLFVHETRVLSRYNATINGQAPICAAFSSLDQRTSIGYFILRPPDFPEKPADSGSGLLDAATQHTLELSVLRRMGDGVHEDLHLTNFSGRPTRFQFVLTFDADFADQGELSRARQQKGKLTKKREGQDSVRPELCFDYEVEHSYEHQGERGQSRLRRGLIVRLDHADSPPAQSRRINLTFDIDLPPRGTWRACLLMIPTLDGEPMGVIHGCAGDGVDPYEERRRRFLNDSTAFEAPLSCSRQQLVIDTLDRATYDLLALRLYDVERDERAWVPAAGLPMYVALFGRDALTASWQAALLGPEMLRGSLQELARWQGRVVNPWRDEQPGRMLHEAHTGPLAVLNMNPRSRYYGSVTTSGFFPVALSEYWHWTGDKQLIEELLPHALAALDWLDRYADVNGDGFYEYQTASADGVRNQGWKDSGDAMVHADGSQAEPPIATCEEQAFVFLAKQHLSEVLWWLGRKTDARRLWNEARQLKKRFNESFWMDDLQFYAMGRTVDGKQIRSISSNPGHCLSAGIVDERYVRLTADRLMAPDLFSGWGIRTLSSEHPAYNPYSYHRGSVWPVEQGSFAIGFVRYGLHDHLERLCRSQFDAASLFDHRRLPELFAGHPRDAQHPVPGLYPRANSPQAWSASSVFCLVQAMLGLYPYAPLNLLIVDPHLPEWLPELTVSNLRVGEAVVTLRFRRQTSGHSDYDVIAKSGSLHIVRQPSPWSLEAGLGERFADVVSSVWH